VRSQVFVSPSKQDDTSRIQAAIDYVSGLPADDNGRRGAVVLWHGEFNVSGQLRIQASGVILRGNGAGEHGTTLRATGRDRRTLIRVLPHQRAEQPAFNMRTFNILDDYVPVGANSVRLNSTEGLAVGAQVEVTHPSSKAWIPAERAETLARIV
jgi:hypothetical protein